MNRAASRRTWEAARNAGVKPLSWRMYDTLLDAARKGGTHVATNGLAAYDLERKGLVTCTHPYATATVKGREVLATIAQAAVACCAECGKPGPKQCALCALKDSSEREHTVD